MQKFQRTGILSMLLLVFSLSNAQPETPVLVDPMGDPTPDLHTAKPEATDADQTKGLGDPIEKEDEVVFPFTVDVTVPLCIYMGLYFMWVDKVGRYIKDQASTNTFIGRHNDACTEIAKVVSGYFLLERFKEQVKLIEGYVYHKAFKPCARFLKNVIKHYSVESTKEKSSTAATALH